MRSDTRATRERLLDAAERLFAERGIDNVTLLEVTRAAGQRNRSALQYHFDGKEGLLHAVLDRHSELIARYRHALLAQLGSDYRLEDAVRCLVAPVAEDLKRGNRFYVQINAHLMASPHWAGFRMERAEIGDVTRRLQNAMTSRMPSLPASELRARLLLIDTMVFHGFAVFACRPKRLALRTFSESLVAAIARVLAAPV